MKFEIEPLGPIPPEAPTLLLQQGDDIRMLVRRAIHSLGALVSQLKPSDLRLRVALMDDGERWLRALIADAESLRSELQNEKCALDELCRQDAVQRNALDGAVTELMFAADAELATLTKTMRDVIDAGEKYMRGALREAGVPSAEIDRIVTEKNADQRAQTEMRINEASRRYDVLHAFLRDPLRRVQQLDESTRTAVEERQRLRCEQRKASGHGTMG
ncbi:hypothetical protein [Rubrivivax benzoatilyticus]|uniref:Uncharacterized protein n=1 Tax=Rubrivivax benzoatilyticus TaxID=316997 RepID=A0ABX0HV44_9BURK|nr:hypothetical protein [Rubrivivax benzoatilyticus]EGJ11959.1 hypothetical protein RBXJA2T_16592 [Rubrivivax benzoatilyticus JA2 = ATCC BAA-35]NHK97481.1 hypothetical protein [Rubrivivax benzoatilyticus]NHL22824.1 hypothetical protein [Rubrivivax benzoatilyticus]